MSPAMQPASRASAATRHADCEASPAAHAASVAISVAHSFDRDILADPLTLDACDDARADPAAP
jgi:hypothetical protein